MGRINYPFRSFAPRVIKFQIMNSDKFQTRQEIINDLIQKLKLLIQADFDGRKIGDEEPIDYPGIKTTKQLLLSLESGASQKELFPLLCSFEKTMFGYENVVGGLVAGGALPSDFADKIYLLVEKMRFDPK